MPTVDPGSKILVSGANGFIAVWVVRTLLEQGYLVRGVVRSQGKGKYLKDVFASYGDKFEIAVVEDITKEGTFDEVVKGIDAIEHVASPLVPSSSNPDDYIKPAVNGTVGLLNSALNFGHAVKRIVITSSTGAVISPANKPVKLDENSWNDAVVKEVEELGGEAGGVKLYLASKTLAEKAAWDFIEKYKAELHWDLVVINPPWVFGPSLQDVKNPESLNSSMKTWYNTIVKQGPKADGALKNSASWVNVRDVAEAHVRSLRKEEAANQRIIVAAGRATWDEWIDIAHSLPRRAADESSFLVVYDTTKEARILGLKYRTKEETVADILEDFKQRGW